MDELQIPSVELVSLLNGITTPDFNVYYERPEILTDIQTKGTVTYKFVDNSPEYTLSKGIGKQNIDIQLDIYGKTSEVTETILIAIESKMREGGHLMTPGTFDVSDPDGYSHLVARFIY